MRLGNACSIPKSFFSMRKTVQAVPSLITAPGVDLPLLGQLASKHATLLPPKTVLFLSEYSLRQATPVCPSSTLLLRASSTGLISSPPLSHYSQSWCIIMLLNRWHLFRRKKITKLGENTLGKSTHLEHINACFKNFSFSESFNYQHTQKQTRKSR